MPFETKLEVFEGPLDLLLHLIQINDLDIADIPIAIITEQYLEYLDLMKALDVNVAGDFLVMASTLMHIKSKMLLPKTEDDMEDMEDPREEIVQPLMEYMQLTEAVDELSSRYILDRDVFKRGIPNEDSTEEEDADSAKVNLFELMNAFKKVVKRRYPDVVLRFKTESWSVKEKVSEISERMRVEQKLFFKDLFATLASVAEMIATFLALLELIKMGLVHAFQEKEGGDILVEATTKAA